MVILLHFLNYPRLAEYSKYLSTVHVKCILSIYLPDHLLELLLHPSLKKFRRIPKTILIISDSFVFRRVAIFFFPSKSIWVAALKMAWNIKKKIIKTYLFKTTNNEKNYIVNHLPIQQWYCNPLEIGSWLIIIF